MSGHDCCGIYPGHHAGCKRAAHVARAVPLAPAQPVQAVLLTERTRFGNETGAGAMRNRCAFTSRDMGDDWPEAFTYAVVLGWDDAMDDMAARFGWDAAVVDFLHDAHRRFEALPDRDDA